MHVAYIHSCVHPDPNVLISVI